MVRTLKRKKKKILDAVETCFIRINDPKRSYKSRLKSINSLENIGAKYPGYIRTIEPLLDFLQSKIKIYGSIVNLKNQQYSEYSIEAIKIRRAAALSILKICKANPAIANEKEINSLIHHLKSIDIREYISISLGYIGKVNPYCLNTLKEILLYQDKPELVVNTIISIGFAGEYDVEPVKDILPNIIDNLNLPTSQTDKTWRIRYNSENALLRMGRKNPETILNLLSNKFINSTDDFKIPAVRIIGKIIKENMAYLDDYFPLLTSEIQTENKILKDNIIYGLGIIGAVRPSSVEPFLPLLFDQTGYASEKAIFRIACSDPDMIFNFVTVNNIPLKGQSWLAVSRPEDLIEFYLNNPDFVDYSLFSAISELTILPADKLEKLRSFAGLLIQKSIENGDRKIIYYLNCVKKHPVLFNEYITQIFKIFNFSDKFYSRYILGALLSLATAYPENKQNIIDNILRLDDRIFDNPYDKILFFRDIGCWKDPTIKDQIIEILHNPPKNVYEEQLLSAILSEISTSEYSMLTKDSLKHLVGIVRANSRVSAVNNSIIALGNILLADKKCKNLILPVILKYLDHYHYRVFTSSEKCIKKIALKYPEMIPLIEDGIKKFKNPTISRRGLRITKKIKKRAAAENQFKQGFTGIAAESKANDVPGNHACDQEVENMKFIIKRDNRYLLERIQWVFFSILFHVPLFLWILTGLLLIIISWILYIFISPLIVPLRLWQCKKNSTNIDKKTSFWNLMKKNPFDRVINKLIIYFESIMLWPLDFTAKFRIGRSVMFPKFKSKSNKRK